MKPEFKIKYCILADYFCCELDSNISESLTEDDVADQWDEHYEELYDIKYEFREGQIETNLPCESSRHYESKSVAAQCPNGEWVGWTYWYGGGKHGEPEAIDWIEHAYDLDCVEEEKMVVVRTFNKSNVND
jgi:hypothetical protein